MSIMEARVLKHPTWIEPEFFSRKSTATGPLSSARFSRRMRKQQRLQVMISAQKPHKSSNGRKSVSVEVSCSYKNFPASIVESGSPCDTFDEAVMLKDKSQAIEPYLNGRCIYLVGMMGSGKTTVAKVLSGVLGYTFFDSDTLIEQDTNGTSVAEIFKLYGEGYFRNKETEALRKLSLLRRLVVSTGGGAVTRPINWKYMNKGISVWLDVPLEALAQRIAAVGTDSRPLLHQESGDEYTKALRRLSIIFEERGEAYANAHARVSLENIATKLGHRDISSITPATIALEALEVIEGYLKEDGSMAIAEF